MSFLKATWANRTVPRLDAANLNRMEQGIADAQPPPRVTALPALPAEGQLAVIDVDEAGTYGGPHQWLLRRRALKQDSAPSIETYQWQVLSGTPLFREVLLDEQIPAAFTVFGTMGGPDITFPFAGVWIVEWGFRGYPWSQNQNLMMVPSLSWDASYAVDNNAAEVSIPAASAQSGGSMASRATKLTVPAAGGVLQSVYRHTSTGATANFSRRYVRATPLRIG